MALPAVHPGGGEGLVLADSASSGEATPVPTAKGMGIPCSSGTSDVREWNRPKMPCPSSTLSDMLIARALCGGSDGPLRGLHTGPWLSLGTALCISQGRSSQNSSCPGVDLQVPSLPLAWAPVTMPPQVREMWVAVCCCVLGWRLFNTQGVLRLSGGRGQRTAQLVVRPWCWLCLLSGSGYSGDLA